MSESLRSELSDPSDEAIDTPILIVGAGPTGLTIANVLAQAGVDFRIIDQKPGPVTESRAVTMHARTLELLQKLGLAERAVRDGHRVGEMSVYRNGRPAGVVSFFEARVQDCTPFPFALICEQSKTERILLSGLDDADRRVNWSTSLRSMTRHANGVTAVIAQQDGTDETVTAKWVVGADGAHSPVRHALGLGFAGETYEQTLFLADVDLDWDLPHGQAQAEVTRDGFLMFFPMAGDRHYRLAGTLPSGIAPDASLAPGDIQAMLDRQSALRPRVVNHHWVSVYRTHHRMAERFRVGRVFLTGDAAHIHSPAGGQGMNTGMGDAFNLGWKLALAAKGEARERLLDSYEAERMPFARAILNGSDRGFKLFDASDPMTREIKMLAVPFLFSAISRFAPARARMFWLLSQLWTSYRDSPAVAESGPVGRLPRAGDRAPYGLFGTGPDNGTGNFAQLTGPGHHLLLFAGSRPDSAAYAAAHQAIGGLLHQFAAPIALHRIAAENRMLNERYGADVPTAVLVRPDGHIAFRGDAADIVALAKYLNAWFVPRDARALHLHRDIAA